MRSMMLFFTAMVFTILSLHAEPTKNIIVVGAFKTKENAISELLMLQAAMNEQGHIIGLQRDDGFKYTTKKSGSFYIVSIEPFGDHDILLTVLDTVKESFPGAHEFVYKEEKSPPVVKKTPVIKQAEATVVEKVPAPREAAEETTAEKVTEVEKAPAPAVAVVSDTTAAKPETVIPAASAAEVPQMPATDKEVEVKESVEVVTPVQPETVKAVPFTEPSQTQSNKGVPDMIIYAGGAVIFVLLLIITIMMRGKKEQEKAPEVEEPAVKETEKVEEAAEVEIHEEAVQEEALPVEAEIPVIPGAKEKSVEIKELIKQQAAEDKVLSVSEEPVTKEVAEAPVKSEPVIELAEIEDILVELEPVVEEISVIPEEIKEVPAAPLRKKREPKKGRGKITKDDLVLFGGNRILVAEDSLINQKVISSLLADSGMEVVIANDGQEAMDMLAEDSNFQMVLMDAHMPIKDGFEATREIRQNPDYDHIPIVALSGDTSLDDIRKMEEAGMEEQLAKPLHVDALYDVMYSYFDIEVEEEDIPEEAEIEEVEEDELLPDTNELHAEDGLDMSGGDMELYKEILNEFVTMYGNSDEVLDGYFVHDNLKPAKALLLDIRGTAASIGARTLADSAEALREVIIDRKEAQYHKLCGKYNEHLKALLSDIEKI